MRDMIMKGDSMIKKYKLGLNLILIACIMMITGACGNPAPIFEKEETFNYESVPDDKDNFSFAQFSIWCPENIKTYKGILYLGAGFQYSSIPYMKEEIFRDIARDNDFIILSSHMRNRVEEDAEIPYWEAESGTGQAMLNALKYFAEESKHPELEHAPLAMWGFSAGGQFSYSFACWKPERVISFVSVKGGRYESDPNNGALKVPGLFFSAEHDLQRRIDAVNELFAENIKKEPLWCLTNELNSGHEEGKTGELAFPWLREVIKQRMPQDTALKKPIKLKELDQSLAWAGDRITGEIAAVLDYKNDKKDSSWLPNEKIAKLWKKFHLQK